MYPGLPLTCLSAKQECFHQNKWHHPGVRAAVREEWTPLLIIHSERCCRICSSLVPCFVIYRPLNTTQQKGKSRMWAWPSVVLLKPGLSTSTCNTNACGFCWHGLKLKKNIVAQRSKWKLLWQEPRLYPNKPLIWKLFGILVNMVNLV